MQKPYSHKEAQVGSHSTHGRVEGAVAGIRKWMKRCVRAIGVGLEWRPEYVT